MRSNWIKAIAALMLILAFMLTGCNDEKKDVKKQAKPATEHKEKDKENGEKKAKAGEPVHQPPHSVFYEIFPMAFYDSNGDGIGDLNGIKAKLDYLKDLGIEGVWLMPINPSPSYHKYDVTNYYEIDPKYGTISDFKQLLAEAHKKDIKVIIDLVINHTSSGHPWFREAISSKDNFYRDWYIWADENTNTMARGEWNQQLWHGSGDNKFYGTFWSGMPDLNFDHPEVRAEMIKIGTYWLKDIGVDGFRIDAVKHVYPEQEVDKNYDWWKQFRAEMQKAKKDAFIVGEVWAPASVVGPFLQHGLSSAFNFDLSEKILASAGQERDAGIAHALKRTRDYYKKMNPEFFDSTFITNHDMERVKSQLFGSVNNAKMAASLLLTLPGTPFLYYGEEIGMEGRKPDEHIREPMLWHKEPGGEGQTKWIQPTYNLGDQATSVEAQQADPNSLYNHYKALIKARRASDIMVLGDIADFRGIKDKPSAVVAFKRVLGDDSLLVLHNMSGKPLSFAIEGEENMYGAAQFTSNDKNEAKAGNDSVSVTMEPYSTIILKKD
jgi:alpha-amylase